jgi:hypothetical protein
MQRLLTDGIDGGAGGEAAEEGGEIDGAGAGGVAVLLEGGLEVLLELFGVDAEGLEELVEGGGGLSGGVGGSWRGGSGGRGGGVLAVGLLEDGGDGVLDGLVGVGAGGGRLEGAGDGILDLAGDSVLMMAVVGGGLGGGVVAEFCEGRSGGGVDAVGGVAKGLIGVVEELIEGRIGVVGIGEAAGNGRHVDSFLDTAEM